MPGSRTDREIWPCGRYEVYATGGDAAEDERLNGFHSQAEADECAGKMADLYPKVIVLDRADRFAW